MDGKGQEFSFIFARKEKILAEIHNLGQKVIYR